MFTLKITFNNGVVNEICVKEISNLACDKQYIMYVTQDNKTYYIDKNLIKRIEIQ